MYTYSYRRLKEWAFLQGFFLKVVENFEWRMAILAHILAPKYAVLTVCPALFQASFIYKLIIPHPNPSKVDSFIIHILQIIDSAHRSPGTHVGFQLVKVQTLLFARPRVSGPEPLPLSTLFYCLCRIRTAM